jgi:hypothetical protein
MICPYPHLIELCRNHQVTCFSVPSLSNCVQNNRDDLPIASRLGSSRLSDSKAGQVKGFEVLAFSGARHLARFVQETDRSVS